MKNTADLYIRVSTDEQADKGYSQRNQEEMLRKYCNNNSIIIRNIIYEDHSAKSFNRPSWKNFLNELKQKRGSISLVLFTKWDRFSRNAGDAYQMISQLRSLGVEPQAIEQPLDLSIPENKMMLAFYLAAPEVENDRRALNVFYGMRRAKKEGRYMGLAPTGYVNKTDEYGKKYIAPKQPDANIIKWVFQILSKETYNTEQIWKSAKNKGLICSKNAFWQLIRNPLYCGKIFLPAFKDEESRFVKGQHESIITEKLFYEVQDVLDGRGRKYRAKIETLDEFPFRGLLHCPECEKKLTGSKSKGRNRYYAYYHCYDGCKHRVNADKINSTIFKDLNSFIPKINNKELIKKTLLSYYTSNYSGDLEDEAQSNILTQIKEYENRISYCRDLMATRQIEPSDYREMKIDYSERITKLEKDLTKTESERMNIESLINHGIENLIKLHYFVENQKVNEIRGYFDSMYPEKTYFSGTAVRTGRRNKFIEYTNLIIKSIDKNKNGTKIDFSTLSRQVGVAGFEPATSCSQSRRDNRATLHPELRF